MCMHFWGRSCIYYSNKENRWSRSKVRADKYLKEEDVEDCSLGNVTLDKK